MALATLKNKTRGRTADVVGKLRQEARDRAPDAPRREPGYQIRNTAGDEAVIRIYDEIWWLGVNADDFVRDLQAVTASRIRVEINSPGGDVFDGIAIYNALRAHPAHITTRVDGVAASIASVIAQAGDHRVMLGAAQIMIHNAWGVTIGDTNDHEDMRVLLEQQDDIIAGIYAARSGRPRAHFRDLMAAETWLSDTRAVDEGLADEVLEPSRQVADTSMADVRAIYDRFQVEEEYRRFVSLRTDLEIKAIHRNLVYSQLGYSTTKAYFTEVGDPLIPADNRRAAAAALTFCTGHLDLDATPTLRFFLPDTPAGIEHRARYGMADWEGIVASENTIGLANRDANEVWIRADLDAGQVMQTVAHECRHLAQQPHHTATDPLAAFTANELDARAYERGFADTYLDREN